MAGEKRGRERETKTSRKEILSENEIYRLRDP